MFKDKTVFASFTDEGKATEFSLGYSIPVNEHFSNYNLDIYGGSLDNMKVHVISHLSKLCEDLKDRNIVNLSIKLPKCIDSKQMKRFLTEELTLISGIPDSDIIVRLGSMNQPMLAQHHLTDTLKKELSKTNKKIKSNI